MENEFKTLSQQDIDALMAEKKGQQQPPPDPGPPLPSDPEGPLPKVVNLTGMNVSSVVPNASVPYSEPEDAPFSSPTGDLPDNSRVKKLEESLNETNAAIQQVRQELQSLVQQVQSLSQSVESIAKGLKDTPSYRVRETFTCGDCQSEQNVAMPVKCTSCGRVNWWGWWPPKGK